MTKVYKDDMTTIDKVMVCVILMGMVMVLIISIGAVVNYLTGLIPS